MRRAALVVAIASLAALAGPAAAGASYDPLGSGRVKLVLDKRFARLLHADRVKLMPSQGAKRKGRAYLLAIAGGQIDPTRGKGQAKAEGALVFRSARRKLPLRQIRVKSTRQPLIAKLGGSQLKLATAGRTKSIRAGFGTRLLATRLHLTYKAITRLNKKLRPRVPFAPGQPLGTLIANAQPRLVTVLDQGTATISLDPAFLAKLDSRFVSLNPIAPAQRFGARASFPIALGGAIAPDGSEGTLRTAGALEFLQLGAGQVFWDELWLDLAARSDTAEVDLEPTPSFPGKIGRVGVLDYAPTTVSADPKGRTISLAGSLSLSAEGAARCNQAFAQNEAPAFAAGEAVGTVGLTAQAQ